MEILGLGLEERAVHRALYRRGDELLRDEAERSALSATALTLQALEKWLQQRRKQRLFEEIAAYAQEHAGTALDLDESLEDATLATIAEDGAPCGLNSE